MNKIINKTKTLIAAAVILIAMGISASSFATVASTPGELRFMGTSGNLPVFQLVLNGSIRSEYSVIVRDSEKRILLSEKLKGASIRRTYKLNMDAVSWISGTTFEVTNKSTGETNVYEVNGTASLVDYVSVAKL